MCAQRATLYMVACAWLYKEARYSVSRVLSVIDFRSDVFVALKKLLLKQEIQGEVTLLSYVH